MHELVQSIAIIVGGITAVCIAVIAWLAGATFKSMKMKERKQSQELNSQLLQVHEGGKDVKAELLKIRADLKDVKELLERHLQQHTISGSSQNHQTETPITETARELRQQ